MTDYFRVDAQVTRKFWLQWTVLTTLGFIIAGFGALGTGLGVGFAQWLLLRVHLNRAYWWIIVSAVGLSLGLVPMFIISVGLMAAEASFAAIAATALFGGAVSGFFCGLGQWLVLRTQAGKAGWWIAISAISWMVWFTIILPGPISGAGMMWLLGSPADEPDPYPVS